MRCQKETDALRRPLVCHLRQASGAITLDFCRIHRLFRNGWFFVFAHVLAATSALDANGAQSATAALDGLAAKNDADSHTGADEHEDDECDDEGAHGCSSCMAWVKALLLWMR